MINTIEIGKEPGKVERYERLQQQVGADSGSKIISELLNEYFLRLIKLLQEPKVMAYQDSAEIQEIIDKTEQLLKKDCLSFDSNEESRENVKSNQSKQRRAVKSSLEEDKSISDSANEAQQPKIKKTKIRTIEGLIAKM